MCWRVALMMVRMVSRLAPSWIWLAFTTVGSLLSPVGGNRKLMSSMSASSGSWSCALLVPCSASAGCASFCSCCLLSSISRRSSAKPCARMASSADLPDLKANLTAWS